MPTFKPVIFQTTSGYQFTVTCLHDVSKVLGMGWPSKACDGYLKAVQLTAKAKQGWCTPKAAHGAFVEAARLQDCIVVQRNLNERVARELASIEPENLNPQGDVHPIGVLFPLRSRMRRPVSFGDAKTNKTQV